MEGLKFENVEQTQLDASTVEAERLRMEQPERKRMLFSLTATLCVGLALALLYLGIRAVHNRPPDRIAAIQRQAAPKPVEKTIMTPVSAPVTVEKSSPVSALLPVPAVESAVKRTVPLSSGDSMQNPNPPGVAYSGVITEPEPGDLYIQAGAFGPRYTQRAIEILQQEQFHPVVAMGPDAYTYRVLIGPLRNMDDANQELAKLQQAGISSWVRRY